MKYLHLTTKGTSESVANLNKLITELNRKDNVIGTLNDTVVAKSNRKKSLKLREIK